MTTTATVDLICFLFIGILYGRGVAGRSQPESGRRFNLCLALMMLSLLADAGAYILTGPAYPLALRYLLNLLSFTMVCVNMIAFTYYIEALFNENSGINPWFLRVLKTIEFVWLFCSVYAYIAGQLVSYDALGLEEVNLSYPVYAVVLSFVVALYLPVITWLNRRKIGRQMALLLTAFGILPVLTSLLYSAAGIDFAYSASALTLVLIAEFIQKKHAQTLRDEQDARLQKALYEATSETKRTEIITDIINGSRWSYELNADDEVTAAKYTERSKTKLGAAHLDRMDWLDVVFPEDRERISEAFYACVRDHSGGTPYNTTFRMFGPEGKTLWIRSGGNVIRRPDGSGEFYGMSLDITAQMELEAQHKEQLEKALAAADAANRAKTDFLFNMSHDIRTPMNAIIGFTDMAKKEIDDREKALDCLNKVQLSSDILLNLINDVLDMSRIESGKVELHEEKYEITEAFDSFEPAMASLAAAKNIDLRFSIGTVRDRFVFADGPRFDRVLINIISNAIKYTPAGGSVRVSAEQIEAARPGYGNYRFTVADNGIGMSEEFQKHMFEDFTREYNSTTSGIQGTGLGLSLAKKLVDLMGGSISCVSAQGVGTTFTIDFPFRLQTAEDIAEKAASGRERAEIDLKGRRALLVEDNELNREIAEEILTGEGIAVEMAVNGKEAVDVLRERGAGYYDFILMDIQMPVMNGYEATGAIRRMMPDLKAPIIALSANAFAEDRKASLAAGMDDHVAKPVNVAELMNVLAKFL